LFFVSSHLGCTIQRRGPANFSSPNSRPAYPIPLQHGH
jgi:hypothetical protein